MDGAQGLGSWTRKAGSATAIATLVVVAGALREIVIARTFGVSPDLDAFLIATAIPLALVSLFGTSWQAAATPEFGEKPRVTSGISYFRVVRLAAIALAVIAALLAVGTSWNFNVTPANLIALSAAIAIGLFSAGWYPLALASGRSNVVVAAPGFVHIGIATTVAIAGSLPMALYGGLLLGNIALYLCLRWFGAPKEFSRHVTLNRKSLRRILRNLVPIVGGGAAMALALPVDLLFASSVNSGGPSILNYATRVPLAASIVGASVIATVVFVDLFENRSVGDIYMMKLRRSAAVAFGFASVAALFIWVASPWIIEVLFASDRLAGPELDAVVATQRVAALSIPPFLLGMVFVRSLNALEINRPLFWISLVNIAINVAGNWILTPILGLSGILVATAIMYICSALFLVHVNQRSLPRVGQPR